MASKIEFVEFVADQLREAGTITYKKMFGEYGLYGDGKIFAVICDDQLFIKKTESGQRLCPKLPEAPPYAGAQNYLLVEDIEDRELLTRLVTETLRELPAPKPKKPKKRKEAEETCGQAQRATDKKDREESGQKKRTAAFDYKKEYKEFYLPKNKPGLVTVPSMNFVAVRGEGDPNLEGGAYKQSIGLLYGIAFTIKMSKMGSHRIEGYFDYVVPPLEGLWWQEGRSGIDYAHKEDFCWISMIRLPEFVTKEDFYWAVAETSAKKGTDFSKVEFFTYEEGLCVQCMHIGPYDDEPATIEAMDAFAGAGGYLPDMGGPRYHHEIYLSDVRRCRPENLRTVIRHPVKKAEKP